MRTIHLLLLVAVAAAQAACDAGSPRQAQDGSRATPAAVGAMEFRGRRACADCQAIDAILQLDYDGGAQRYRMVEVFLGDRGERRFEEHGAWTADGDLLRLHSDAGHERLYARLADGRLQARGSRGRRLAALEDDMMTPVTFRNGP